MRAIVTTGQNDIQLIDAPIPAPGPGQVRLRVVAAGTNPVDNAIKAGGFHRAGFITQTGNTGLGWDVAGTIDALGADVSDLAIGATVAALLDEFDVPLGAYADYVVVAADSVAAIPDGVDPTHAVTVGVNALAAEQALDFLTPDNGNALLITGAAGAVGGYAITLATRRGWKVSALARSTDAEFLTSAGAVEALTELRADQRFDAAIDAGVLGAPVLDAIRDGGTYVGLQPGGAPDAVRNIEISVVMSHHDGNRMAGLLKSVAAGELATRVAGTLPLEDAAKALELVAAGGRRGRWILVP